MDERHWWIAGKIQESFKLGSNDDNSSLLEDFMCEESTLSQVNTFLKAEGPCRIFFYCTSPSASEVATRKLQCTGSLTVLKDVDLERTVILYFLRHETDKDVDPTTMERNIFCGELKHNTVQILNSLLTDIYIPIIKVQKDWGKCSEEGKKNLMFSMDKFVTALNESTASMSYSRQMILQQPEKIVETDFKMQRVGALDPQVIIKYEQLVCDWMNTIETILNDASDESFLDPNAGPMSELEKWRRKWRLLTNVAEQLKGKECKAVLAALITAKSKQLKRWKIIDASITDNLNDTKDKVRYMESLKRYFDQINQDASPASIMKNAIPGLVNCIKQMDSISRFYARTGFLGVLLTKVTNQLVQACKSYIKQYTYNDLEDKDELWDRVIEEVFGSDSQHDAHHKFFNMMMVSKLEESKENKSGDVHASEDNLYARLRMCLSLQTFYRDSLRSLREALVKSQSQSRLSSVNSFSTITPVKRESIVPVSKPSQHKPGVHPAGYGVPITDEDAIMAHFDKFCRRVLQVFEVLNTMSQFIKLNGCVTDIPRLRKEDITTKRLSRTEYNKHRKQRDPLLELLDKEVDNNTFDVPKIHVTDIHDYQLTAIKEDEEQIQNENADNNSMEAYTDHGYYHHVGSDLSIGFEGFSEEEISVLREYYPEDEAVDGPSISTVVEQHLTKMNDILKNNITTKIMLDVESKEREIFDCHYSTFQSIVQNLERFLRVYLHVIFMQKMKTQQGLDIITKFNPVANRSGISGTVAEKYAKVFEWYESDLHEVQKIYERHKENPLIVRNAPPVAGAICWSRQLLKRIEDPMKILQNNKAVTSLADFGSQVRIYNRLATALVTFESLWFTQWKRNIEKTCSGLMITLFVIHPETGEIVVNSDDKVLELIHEAKWMTRLGIQIPNSALSVMQEEERLKGYKSHLELVLKNFREVCQSIPRSLLKLFNPHIEFVHQQFQPGLSTLAWNSMNIDVFLHQIHSATEKLRSLLNRVNQVLDDKINTVIDIINNFSLYEKEEAFSRTWTVDEFHAEMRKSIKEKSRTLRHHVLTICEGLQTITELLTTRKLDIKQLMKERKSQLILNNEEYKKDKLETIEEANVLELSTHFKNQVFQAVLNATTKSLACLAHACGCTGEVIRTFTPTSQENQSDCNSPRPSYYIYQSKASNSRVNSAQDRGQHSPVSDRPESHMSNLSETDWLPSRSMATSTFLQLEVSVKFSIPNIIIEPTLDVMQKTITDTANSILQAVREISWGDSSSEETFYDNIRKDSNVQELNSQLSTVVEEHCDQVNKQLFHFSYYNFLWKDDMCGNFSEFIMADPGEMAIKREVERYLNLEKKVMEIQSRISVGPITLFSDPLKDSLRGFCLAWKTKFASILHEEAKKRLDNVVSYRSTVMSKLGQYVQTLDQLNSALQLMEELRDMENKIDGLYLPVEAMYVKLREFELRLPRSELEEVDGLREKWSQVMQLADQVKEELLKERRGVFEQELDKQVKTFVVEVIQFRNAFDAQGPAIPGIQPAEAVSRLYDFQHRFSMYDAKRNTLNSVSKLFSIACKPFLELDKTGEELKLLSQLYGLFQKLIHFDNKFKDMLWAEVDLKSSADEVEGFWDECLALPSKLKVWDAYNDLKNKLQNYLEIFPLLQKLSSKEIRNRHWLQVMQVSHSSFQLEGSVFKISHILNIELFKYKAEVEEICKGANRELELEIKMRMTEEEWTEQVLNFEHYKKRGPIFLDKSFTERLLEQLEDAEVLLATMLTSRYIGPMRDEAASWAEKLKEVAKVLELWLEVQNVWQYLEAVFSNSLTVKELPQEAKRFARLDKGWTKMMKRAFDTRNVLQCCYGEEVPKAVVLHNIQEELEICFKSLMGYLDNKRQAFPRFYFVSDPVLLALLSRPNDLVSVRPHLKSIFSAIADVKLEATSMSLIGGNDVHSSPNSHGTKHTSEMASLQLDQAKSSNALSNLTRVKTPPKIDKRLHQHYNLSHSGQVDASIMLPSEGLVNDKTIMDATAVVSADGEVLNLSDQVSLVDDVEIWLKKLRDSVGKELRLLNQAVITDCQNGVGFEEWALKYPSQVCRTGMLYHWSAECHAGITEIKYEKKSLQGTLRKFNMATSRLVTVLLKRLWKASDEPVLPVHCLRLEVMITQSTYLKDILENLCQRKLKDTTDFEWRRSVRCYLQPATTDDKEDGADAFGAAAELKLAPHIWILDSHYEYGKEFYGTGTAVPITPVTEKCFLAMTLSLKQMMGTLLMGPHGSGKTETVKGLANLLGNYVGVFQVSKEFDCSSIGRIAQGLAMDGCWGCFDQVQSLSQHCLSVLLDYAQSIFQALQARQSHVILVDGTEIPLCKTVGLFLCTSMLDEQNKRLPRDVTESFRTVSLILPDIGLVLKAKCSSMGFRAPTVLANRMKILVELTKNQLPPEVHHYFSIETLLGVLKRARQKRRKDKFPVKNTMKDEASRSESQNSESPTSRNKQPAVNALVITNKMSQTSIICKPGTPITLTSQGKQDHALVCEAIDEIISPRLTSENQELFKNILKSCFCNLPKPDVQMKTSSEKEHCVSSSKVQSPKIYKNIPDFESALVSKAVESRLVPHKPWITKCLHLYNLSQVYTGLIVAGPPGSGKSSCIQTVVDALNVQTQASSQASHVGKASTESIQRLLRINPMVVDDKAHIFGSLGPKNEWVDGIFTHAVRKANRNRSTTWLCLDGILNQSWTDSFSSILSKEKVLHLKNGDKLFLSDRIMLLFETDDLNHATPSTVSSCGILYIDRDIVGWRPITRAWLDSRTHLEAHVLHKAFQKTLDPISSFILIETRPQLRLCEVGMLKTCLGLLEAMLADNIEVSGELHIERLYLFCLMWTFGGMLDTNDLKAFSDLLKTLSTAMPDDDRDICVFDYYVDESGEWDPWNSRVPEIMYTDSQDILDEVFVETVDTVRTRMLMEFSIAAGRNVLLAGPHGSGKSAIVNDFFRRQDPQLSVCKQLVFSGASTATQFQQFIESNIHHRQGFVYGAMDKKKLKIFIDDINLPPSDQNGTQKCNELLRQLLDEKQFCTLHKPFEWHSIEDLSVISAMTVNENSAFCNRSITERLMRHFSVFWLPAPQDDSLKRIVHSILETNMKAGDAPGLDIDLHSAIVSVSCAMLTAIQSVLRPSPTNGRHHYLFTIKDIKTCFQSLRRLAHESRADEILMISIWKHELNRIVRDRITQTSDLIWFDDKLDGVIQGMWKYMKSDLHEYFITFSPDVYMLQRPVTSLGSKHIKVSLQLIKNMGDLHSFLHKYLTRYNEEFCNSGQSIMLSDYVITHIVRLHRVLSLNNGGNVLLIGALGSHLSTLCCLASYIAGIPVHKVDTSKHNFSDRLRSAIRLWGSEGKVISLLLTSQDLHDTRYLDAINSLLICGEYLHLFSNDEIDGLLQAILPTMKREFPGSSMDPMKFFVSRVKSNLHILICLQPSHELLKTAHNNFPGFLKGCQIIWMCDWSQEALLSEASYFVATHQICEQFENLRENIITSLASIHSYVLNDCKQLPWAGDVSAEICMTSYSAQDKKKDQLTVDTAMVPNLPYSKLILQERIKLNHRDTENKAKNEIYVGPTTYRWFMESFRRLYFQKAEERTRSVEKLKKVIATLDKTRADAKIMKNGIRTTTAKFDEAQKNTDDFLKKLTSKVTTLEKLKAKVGLSKSLDAYLQLNELDVEQDEEDVLLKEEEYDEHDAEFDRRREASLQTRGVQAKEELVDVQVRVEECRTSLAYAREQVMFWRSKVDRNVVERVRAFQNPPLLVGQVFEMLLVLIGKRLPSQRNSEVKESYASKEELSSRLSTSSSSSKLVVKKAKIKDASDRFDKTQWKTIQQTMTDSVKFVDMLHNISWEDGLPKEVLAAVESYLACNKDGQLGVTGEGSLLENAQSKQFQATKQRSPSPGERGGLTLAGVKYASEDCATLVHYTIAIVEYSRLCGPLRMAIERMHELEREIGENEELQRQQEQESDKEEEPKLQEEDEDLTEADLPRIQQEIDQLKPKFDQAVVEKHSLGIEFQSMNEQLKAATELVGSLKSQENKWRIDVSDNDCNEILLANCITAAGILTYCGAVNIDTRHRMGEFFMKTCEHNGLPLHKEQLFRTLELTDFLYTPLDLMRLQQLQLPINHLMLENTCFLMQPVYITAWPLVCDPTSRFIDWLRLFYADKQLVQVKYHEIRSQLDNCLSDGTPLLVTDCDMRSLMNDQRFMSTLKNCVSFISGKSRFKVKVTDHEVECDPGFRLYLHTTSEPHICPHELAVLTSVAFFQQSGAGDEQELLDIFMAQEKSRLNNEWITLRKEKKENTEMLENLDQQMRDQLSTNIRLMSNLPVTKRLLELKKHFDETLESQAHVQSNEDTIMKAREGFRAIAQRAAVCFDTACYMREVNSFYQTSFKQFVSIYQAAIAHSERSSVKAVIDRLTFSAFLTVARGFLERDRFIFALLLAIEIEDSRGNVGQGEREFVISPNFCSAVMSNITASQNVDSHSTQSKKPFDWMTDDQFHNLEILATHFDWFKDIFDRISKDGRETLWRNLCESDFPENMPLPDKMDDTLKPIQILCILRAVQSDRLLHASSSFISHVLDNKYLVDISLDLPTVLKQSTPSIPIMLLFETEAEMTVKIFQDFSIKKQNHYQTVMLTDNSVTDEKAVKKQILKGMNEGTWILLHNAHNCPHLLNSFESILNEGLQQCDSNFRLWISSHVGSSVVPVHLLHNSIKVYVDCPKVMRDSLTRSFSWMEPEILKKSNRPEWPAMLHNLCYLHAAIQLRTRFGTGGWNLPHEFSSIGFRELQEAVSFSAGEFSEPVFVKTSDGSSVPRTMSWTGIRYLLSEIVYGTFITDVYDQHSLSAMVDLWCGSNAVKKDFEVARLKYRTPAVFFSPTVKLNTLTQAFDGLTKYCLEIPEACHLHPNSETLLGDDQYIFTRLNKVFDAMPSSRSLSHQLFPRPPSPFLGQAVAGVSSHSDNPLIVDQGVLSSASYTTYKMRKDVDLWETCHSLLQKVPKAFSKDFLAEKVKKIGGFTAFNKFILNEMELMYRLVSEIRASLQAIKTATESCVLGDHISQHTLEVADAVYHLQIPGAWRQMSGNSAPPLTYGIGQWLVDLQNRCHHFERILTLGREKMPAYWLGAFFNPRGLLALLKQDKVRNYANERSGNFEPFTFQTEFTSRDKEHLRDPPLEGMFVWGIYVWGCTWERTTGELQDLPPRNSFSALPVVHITCWPVGEKPIMQDSTHASETYQCPVYHSRQERTEVVLELDVRKEGIPASRWALRGLSATIRPH